MEKTILNELTNFNWVWFWSGNWPLLDAVTERDAAFEYEFDKLAGIHPRVTVDLFKEGIIHAYHCQEEYDRMEKYLLKRFSTDPNFIVRSFRGYEHRTLLDIWAIRLLLMKNLSKLSNKQLSLLFVRVRKHWQYNSAIDHWAWYIERFFTPLLEKYLRDRLLSLGESDPHYVSDYLNVLVSPRKPSEVYRERVAFFELAMRIKKDSRLVEILKGTNEFSTLQKKTPDLAKLIHRHIKRYGWLPVLVNNSAASESDLFVELSEKIQGDISLDLEVKRLGDNFDIRILERKDELITKLKPDSRMLTLIKTLERTAYIRTHDNAVMSRSAYLTQPLYQEVADRLSITYFELKELTPDEIVTALLEKTDVTLLVKSRYILSSYVVYKGDRFAFEGMEAQKLKELINSSIHIQTRSDVNFFQGTPASSGITQGRARVVTSSKELQLFRSGDILIAPATSADFVTAMRKAIAIVTQMGGLTSHASIVAREFGIPCIVGVTDIINHVKTGDFLKVDANTGRIERIQQD